MAYELIETVEVGAGGASSIEFSSIPNDGVDLIVKFSARYSDFASSQIDINLNNDAVGSNYLYALMRSSSGSFSTAASQNPIYGATMNENNDTANTFSNVELYFPNYTSSDKKRWHMDGIRAQNSNAQTVHLIVYEWNNTNAITSIKFTDSSGTIAENSTASLYKITAA